MKRTSMWITCILFIFVTYIWMEFIFFFVVTRINSNWKNIQQHYFPFRIVYFFPNFNSVFLYRLFRWIFLHILSLTLYCFSCNSVETIISGLPTLHWTKNPDLSKMKCLFFYCGNVNIFMKDICYFLIKKKTFLWH